MVEARESESKEEWEHGIMGARHSVNKARRRQGKVGARHGQSMAKREEGKTKQLVLRFLCGGEVSIEWRRKLFVYMLS